MVVTMRNSCAVSLGISVLFGAFLVSGCGGKGGSTLPAGSLADRMECKDTGQVAATDLDGDGRADVVHVFSDGKRQCSRMDLNFDGKVDLSRFYAADGETAVVEQHDFDFDGRVDQLSFFDRGALSRKELDTNFDNIIDTWMWCGGGWVTRAERDRMHTGRPDTWETYEEGLITEASYDNDNDGKPEKWEMFRKGKLIVYRQDTNHDGEPDKTEEIPLQDVGPADDALRCERGPNEKNMHESPKGLAEKGSNGADPPPPAKVGEGGKEAADAVDTEGGETQLGGSVEPSKDSDGGQ